MKTTTGTRTHVPAPPLQTPLRQIVTGVLYLLAFNAFAGGYYGMAGAPHVPVTWLTGSPFHSYSVPGLILFTLVGGSLLLAGVAVLARMEWARRLVTAAGLILFGWLAVQVAIIGMVSWMQPVTALMGMFILAVAWLWPGHLPAMRASSA